MLRFQANVLLIDGAALLFDGAALLFDVLFDTVELLLFDQLRYLRQASSVLHGTGLEVNTKYRFRSNRQWYSTLDAFRASSL